MRFARSLCERTRSESDDAPADPDANWCWNNYISFRAMQQADNVRNQLKRSMEKLDLCAVPPALSLLASDPLTPPLASTRSDLVSTSFEDKSYYENIQRALTCGFFMQVAHKEGDKKSGYMTIKDLQVVGLHPSTGLDHNPEWVIYNGAYDYSRPLRTGAVGRGVAKNRPVLLVSVLVARADFTAISALFRMQSSFSLRGTLCAPSPRRGQNGAFCLPLPCSGRLPAPSSRSEPAPYPRDLLADSA